MKKVCVITGTRAEYGLLYWTIKGILASPLLELQLCVTGMHLSPEFGLTYKQIENDGFEIDEKLEMLLSSDTSVGISKGIGIGVISFSEAYTRLQPDIILILGDRFEIFAAAIAAMIANIPIAHCHGGEATEGLIDESIRHSITKMAHLHFAAAEVYRKRIIQLGEQPDKVFNVGALGIENINRLTMLGKAELEKDLKFRFGDMSFLVTFHPVTLEKSTAQDQFDELLKAVSYFPRANIIFTKPNADTDGRIIIKMIDEFVSAHPQNSVSFISMGQVRYLSALSFVDVVIGNSSSGLLEVPSFQKATINIGDRQKGRLKAKSVIDCEPLENDIRGAIELALSPAFKQKLKHVENPYGKGNASASIVETLEHVDLTSILKKAFYNL